MIKLGVVGTHWITQQLVDATVSTGKYELTAVYSRKMQTADEFAKKNNCENTFDNLDEFFSSDSFDTVYIASPNIMHCEQALKAIKNDKNVIVEKPAFTGSFQLQQIFDALADHPNVHLFEAARNIHMPAFEETRKILSKWGRLDGANFTYSKYSSRYDAVLSGETPNVFNLKFGGGALQDLGVYPIYDAICLLGRPETQKYYPTFIKTGADGKGTAVLNYGDFDVTLNFSKISTSYNESEIYNGKNTISIDSAGDFTEAKITDGEKSEIESQKYTDNPMIPEVMDFARVLENPGDRNNQEDYERWLELTKSVNIVMSNLAASAGIDYFK